MTHRLSHLELTAAPDPRNSAIRRSSVFISPVRSGSRLAAVSISTAAGTCFAATRIFAASSRYCTESGSNRIALVIN